MNNYTIYKHFDAILLVMFGTVIINGFINSAVVVFIALFLMVPVIVKNISLLPLKMSHFSVCLFCLFLIYPIINGSSFLYPMKYISYLISFLFGYVTCCMGININCKKWIMFVIIFVPILHFVFIAHGEGGGLFDLANTYVYYGLSVSMIYYILNIEDGKVIRRSYIIILLFILTATKLGVVFAFFLSLIFYSIRRSKNILFIVFISMFSIITITYIDLPIFVRIRNVFDLASSIPLEEYVNIGDSSTNEIGKTYGNNESGENDTSFVFRLVHWSRIMTFWINSDFLHLLFGYGDMYAKEKFTFQPHNEYVKLLFENGILVFAMFIVFVKKTFEWLCIYKIRYLFFAPLAYFFTENLLYFTTMNVAVFMSLGYLACNVNQNNIINK